jgi:hypothetical protein
MNRHVAIADEPGHCHHYADFTFFYNWSAKFANQDIEEATESKPLCIVHLLPPLRNALES